MSAYPSRFASQMGSAYNNSPLAMVSTTPRFNIRTNRQKDPYDVTGDRMMQGAVDVNLLCNDRLIHSRQKTAKNARAKGFQTLGTLTNIDNIQLNQNDLVFVPKMQRNNNGTLFGSTADPLAFSSFTGINASTEIFANQDAFEDSFRLVGRAKIPYKFGSAEQRKDGISVQVSGACTVFNIGTTTFAFGDAVKWRLYDAFDERARESQIMSIRKPRGEPPEKFSAILERATYRDIFKLTQNALERYIKAAGRSPAERDAYLLEHYRDRLPNKAEFDALRRHFRAECVQSTAVDAWQAVATLQQLGLVSITIPNQASDVDVLRDVKLEDLKSKTFLPGQNGAAPQLSNNNNQDKAVQWKQVLNLAYLLNVAKDPAADFKPLPSLLHTLIMRKYAGLLESDNSYRQRASASILHAGPSDLLVNGRPAQGSQEERLHLAQLNAAREADAQFYAAYRRASSQIFATALSTTSEPGFKLDILM